MTDYEAIIDILENEGSITSKVAKLVNQNGSASSENAIVFGDMPDTQTSYPYISVRRLTKDKLNGIETGFFIADCYADNMTDSVNLAEAVDELFTDSFCFPQGMLLKAQVI